MWSIELLKNEPIISKKCADEIWKIDAEEECVEAKCLNSYRCENKKHTKQLVGEIFHSKEYVIDGEGHLGFNSDHMEHMDYLANNEKIIECLKKHRVKGDICFGSLDGDNAGSFWGYRFDGKGNMTPLVGELTWTQDP